MSSIQSQEVSLGSLSPRLAIRERWVLGFFFLSGAISLIYQVLWVRILALFFGSDVYSAAVTLSVFMGGLALGSWLASRFVDRINRPLMIYGFCETLASLTALAVPEILEQFHRLYHIVYVDFFDSSPWIYHLFRVAVAVAALSIPTTLMGATLPLLVRTFARRIDDLGKQVGRLYAVNTLGAMFGTLSAGFALLPSLGAARTLGIVVATGLAIGLASIALGRRLRVPVALGKLPTVIREIHPMLTYPDNTRTSVLVAIGVSGMAALALEVVWMRVLVQSFSATVYAFSIMLTCFLFGLFYGSAKAAARVDSSADQVGALAYLQLALALSGALLAVLTYVIPRFFGAMVWSITGVSGGAFGLASVIAQFIIASLLILGPTVLLGATFPYAVRAVTGHVDVRGKGAGSVYAANTAGAILGSLSAAFLVLPAAGTTGSLLVIALVFALNGLLLRPKQAGSRRSVVLLLGALSAGVVATRLPRQTAVNYNLQQSMSPFVLYHGDGISNTVDIIRNKQDQLLMMINGNVEADTSFIQRRHFILKAYLPLLLHPAPKDVAVVGLGLGITLSAMARYPSVSNIRLIELSPDMVKAHSDPHLRELTGNILDNKKVRLRIDDGRNFMAMTDERFDVITADPVHPRITGVGYLYTKEYYEALNARLRSHGVVLQWMPMYNISPQSFDVAFRTFAQVFPNATFWYVRGHGLFVATREKSTISCNNLLAGFVVPAVKEDLASIGIQTSGELLGLLMMDQQHIGKYLNRTPVQTINTDDNAWLEYRTPFEFLGRTDAILPELVRYSGRNLNEILSDDCSDELKRAAEAAFETRMRQAIRELSEPIR